MDTVAVTVRDYGLGCAGGSWCLAGSGARITAMVGLGLRPGTIVAGRKANSGVAPADALPLVRPQGHHQLKRSMKPILPAWQPAAHRIRNRCHRNTTSAPT